MKHIYYFLIFCALLVQAPFAHANVITIRTGQYLGAPGSCLDPDESFHCYAPQTSCGVPLIQTPFQPIDFDMACTGPNAEVASPYPGWTASLACDPDARWIANYVYPGSCYASDVSVLYCAAFEVGPECTLADSIKICWIVDDSLGDPSGNGPNQGGVYINGISLGSNFTGGNHVQESSAIAQSVTILPGLNHIQFYQRDLGCAAAGLLMSCTIYTSCGTVPVQQRTWGSVKSLYR